MFVVKGTFYILKEHSNVERYLYLTEDGERIWTENEAYLFKSTEEAHNEVRLWKSEYVKGMIDGSVPITIIEKLVNIELFEV